MNGAKGQILAERAAAPMIGLVVIGRNEGERLAGCFRSLGDLCRQTVYVDSGSTDGSLELAARSGTQVVCLDEALPFTAARARNAGFRRLLEVFPGVQLVQFIDGDCELDRSWLTVAIPFLQDRPDIALVFGRRRERHPERSIFNRLCDLEWHGEPGAVTECGGDVLVRAEILSRLGGYRDELIAGEEPELCIRIRSLGLGIWRLDAEMTRHDAAMTRFGQWWRRTTRAGHAYAQVSRLHKASPFGIWKRNIRRTVFWTGLLPLTLLLSAIQPIAAVLLLLYPLQVLRLALRQEGHIRWTHGLFSVLGKFAEMQGVLHYYIRTFLNRSPQILEYK